MEFEIGDLITAAATNHDVLYKVVSIMDTPNGKRLTVAVKDDSTGQWDALRGEFNFDLFTLSYATKTSKDDVAYYEAITQEQEGF